MQSPTYAAQGFAHGFESLFRFGVPQIDIWNPDRSDVPAPCEPRRPSHPRPARPYPTEPPPEWQTLYATMTDDERLLYRDIASEEAREECNLREHYGHGDPDCMTGHRLVAEDALEALAQGKPRSWWCDDYSTDLLLSLYGKMGEAEDAHAAAQMAHRAAWVAAQTAPDTDPAWRAHDEAVKAWPAVQADYLERVRLRAVERTGYASREAAAAEWAGRAERGEA